MISLVGYTGFVGSNIYDKGREQIKGLYNSKNITEAYGSRPDILIYAGVRAEKYLANSHPEKDLQLIEEAKENIIKIEPKRIVLISTVDVFNNPVGVDENSELLKEGLQPYGYNRLLLENWVRDSFLGRATIIRLPGLYGKNIKKNFIYDYINRIPFMLREDKIQELGKTKASIYDYYSPLDNGFYRLKDISSGEKKELRNIFDMLNFSALNFTDSRSSFQFYPIRRLWDDINICLESKIEIFHPATMPITAAALYEYLTGSCFCNEISDSPAQYDYKTMHYELFDGSRGYIMDREEVLEDIGRFIENEACNI